MVAVLAAAPRVVNEQALALAPLAGWLLLGAAACVGALAIAHREALRRLCFRLEDPRPLAAFRVLFGSACLCNVNGLWELFEYLFTDEGLFTTEVARQVFAAEQFAGYGNGLGDDPHGFFDARAVLTWLRGPRYSLLFFWDSPRFFWAHLVAFELAMLCFIVGYKTRVTKWVAWFLFHSIISRNNVYWEGTENVYRTFFFYLCLARCDRAYSVDAWLAARAARRRGETVTLRRVPAWPRLLVMLQCAAIYCYTGAVKNGAVWWQGDALYYALNLDHFYRVPPQAAAAIFGTNLFRVATHVTHAWETLFPLVLLGLWGRFVARAGLEPQGASRWVARLAWLGLGAFALALVWWLYPVHYVAAAGGRSLAQLRTLFAVGWLGGMAVIGYGAWRLRERPLRLSLRGRSVVLDRQWLCRWLLGRRLWLGLGVIFHLHLIVLMNIGWFSIGCLTAFVCFLDGRELGALLDRVPRPRWARCTGALEPAATLERGRDGWRVPPRVLWTALAVAVLGVPLQVFAALDYGWTLLGGFALLAGATWRGLRDGAASPREPVPLAYGPIGRLLVGALVTYHVVAVALWLLPDKDSFAWRTAAQRPFTWWLRTTQTTQGWKMFAPNPPRSNVMLRVLVTDAAGTQWDMNTDVYAPEKRPIPSIWYTRERKINRRIAGGEGGDGEWYQKWHARYWCRRWILEHGGEIPRKVELIKVSYPIPDPQWLREHGPYEPMARLREHGTQRAVYTAACATEPEARPDAELRARRGLPAHDDQVPRWDALVDRLRAWQRRQARADATDAPED